MPPDTMLLFQLVFGVILPIAVLVSVTIWSIKNGIVPMPTNPRQTKCILKNLTDHPGPVIFDLGSGFGTLAISIAKRFPQSTVIGVESSPVPYLVSCFMQKLLRISNLKLRREDIFKTSVANASSVVVYLHREGMRNLKFKLEEELKPDVWIISNTFAFSEWKPLKVVSVGDFNQTKIYVYRSNESFSKSEDVQC